MPVSGARARCGPLLQRRLLPGSWGPDEGKGPGAKCRKSLCLNIVLINSTPVRDALLWGTEFLAKGMKRSLNGHVVCDGQVK